MKPGGTVKRFMVIAVAGFGLAGCQADDASTEAAEIEMQELSGEWSPVISVHGYYDNRAAADEVVRGLKLVSTADGHEPRLYRVRP